MGPQLIALYSPVMQSGKSEVANTLQLSRGFRLVKFADPFKAFVRDLLVSGGASPSAAERMVEDGGLKEKPIATLGGVTVRRMLQTLGSDWGRNLIHPDLWLSVARRRVEEAWACGQSVVIDDLRFPNEYEAVIQLGGTPVRVIRPGRAAYAGHASEGQLDSYPMLELTNNGTLAQLRACAETLPELIAQRNH